MKTCCGAVTAAAILVVCVLLPVCAFGDEIVFKDDFSAEALQDVWVPTYEGLAKGAGLKAANGVLRAMHSTCWALDKPQLSLDESPQGYRVSLDMAFRPRQGYEWQQTSNPFPLRLVNKRGTSEVYMRLALIDLNGDRLTDAIRLETKNATQKLVTLLPDFDPAKDKKPHRFSIEWRPEEVKAYFDGKLFATHTISIKESLRLTAWNEYITTLIDNVEIAKLAPWG